MAQDTRALLLNQAESLFAERGFYGVSIAAIANELGLTKQALLHHFGSKEKLYGEVLRSISARFDLDMSEKADPTARLILYFTELQSPNRFSADATRVLMRELLDNKRRADSAGTWYLKPFLDRLISMVQAVPNWRDASDAEALAFVYQILGAINYFGISEPTLSGIFGQAGYAEFQSAFPAQLETLIRAGLSARS